MSAALIAAVFLLAAGIAPAVVLIGRRAEALPLAILLTTLICSVGGMAAVVFGGSVLAWSAWILLVVNAVATRVLMKKRVAGLRVEAGQIGLFLAALLPLLALRRPVVDWDARSIWSLHSRWFYAGGHYVRKALGNPAFAFSHSDYPPGVPATVATVWKLLGRIDPAAGQFVIGILNFAVALLVGLGVARLASDAPAVLRFGLGLIAALGTFGIAGHTGANGYVDLLWAAGVGSGVVYLLMSPQKESNLIIGLVCLLVAGMAKNEGTIIGLFILVLATLRYRAGGRQLMPFVGCAVAFIPWPLISRAFGATSDLAEGAKQALGGDSQVVERLSETARAIASGVLPILVAAVLCALAGWGVLGTTRRSMFLGSPMWNWAAIAGSVTIIGSAYLISPHDLRWHLSTSIDRTTIGLELLLFLECLCWAAVALKCLIPTNSRTGSEEPSDYDSRSRPSEWRRKARVQPE